MDERGSGRPRRKGRPTRRYLFLGLLLVALAAPAGYVLAGQETRPYVVVLSEDAVASTVGSRARPARVIGRDWTARNAGEEQRRVNGERVRRHVADVAARTRVRPQNVYTSAIAGFSADLTPTQVRTLERDPTIAAVVPDEEMSLGEIDAGLGAGGVRTTASPRDSVPAGVRRVGAARSTVARVDGRDSRVNADVAILDTGIERNHPDLNVAGGYNCTSRQRNRWDDNDGHGTHVAGIVGALDNRYGVVGVAPGARLWSVKVLDGNGRGRVSWMVCGIDWVTAQRDRAGRPLFEVANMSISFGLSGARDGDCRRGKIDSLHQAICRSVARGTVYVVAAGNESRNARLNRPAAYDEVITVSALADFDGRGGGRASSSGSCPYWTPERDDAFTRFSNYGADVDLIAPGRCVLSTYPRKRYAWMSGTSMASPHVAGAAAVYRSVYPRATPQQVRLALRAVATHDWRISSDPDRQPEKAVWMGWFRTMPDFSVSARSTSAGFAAASSTTALTVSPAAAAALSVAISRTGGFEDAVTVELVDPPDGITARSVSTTSTSAVLTLTIAPGVRAGAYTVAVRAVSGDIERITSVPLTVAGAPPQAAFTAVGAGELIVTAGSSFTTSWTERPGGAPIVARTLTRQSGRVRTPGTCADAGWTTDYTQPRTSPAGERLRSGYCYRWRLTLTDAAGSEASVDSGTVLVDTTEPSPPSVVVGGQGSAYVGHSGTLWVRGGMAGSVELIVAATDQESAVASNQVTVEGSAGWRSEWIGESADGRLRLSFTSRAERAAVEVWSTNRAGLSGEPTVGVAVPDSTAPAPAAWLSVPSGTVVNVSPRSVVLKWSDGSDAGSGFADAHLVTRYRAPLTARGGCAPTRFVADGSAQLLASGAMDTGLAPGACYVWALRSLDNVGNAAPVVWSGYVVTAPR